MKKVKIKLGDGRVIDLELDGTEEVLFEWYEKQCGKGVTKMKKKTTINEFIEQDKIATMLEKCK